MARKSVHVVGTGTIGEPLIGLLCRMKDHFGFEEVTFHKRTPMLEDRSKVTALLQDGALLAADPESYEGFHKMGMEPSLTASEALQRATVVIDCTPVGNQNKEKLYVPYARNVKGFLAQGSEFGFGKMYARGINDGALVPGEDRFVQIVSCNTHNIAAVIHTLGMDNGADPENLAEGRFLCMRRANDISQESSFVPAPQAGKHEDELFGTHHARDAWHLFKTLGLEFDLYSSAVKVNTQYMHTIWFQLRVRNAATLEGLHAQIQANRRMAVTYKKSSGTVFSFGRDHGYYGRILNQTVLPIRSLAVSKGGTQITGFCYTPQDGNSILSSVAAATWLIHPEDYESRLDCLRPFIFQEV
jgi:glyceraldehyde-3-phosphate dehydrogenase (NAD(P))